MNVIEVGPRKTYYNNESREMVAEFSDRSYTLTLDEPLTSKSKIDTCGSLFVSGIMMLSHISQIEYALESQGYKGKITIKDNGTL